MAQTEKVSDSASSASTARTQRLLECYQRGVRLATCDKDYEYAHAMFAECVLHDPGNLKFAEAMIQNLRASMPKGKKSVLRFGRGGSRAIKSAQQRNKWDEVIRNGLNSLKTNPWDVMILQAMAEACAALHHNEVELVYLKQALDAEPKNVAVNTHCARSLGRMGQFDQAIACWHRVEKLKGSDAEAAKMISLLAEEKLKYPGGRPPVVQAKQASAGDLVPEATPREVVLSTQQLLEKAIAADPKNVANYLELAELLLGSNRFDEAEAILSRAVAACGEQQAFLDQLQEIRFLRAEADQKTVAKREGAHQKQNEPFRTPWLEFALAGALLVLAVQLVPGLQRIIDVTQWSRSDWFLFNVIVLLALFAVRYAPELRSAFHRQTGRARVHAEKSPSNTQRR